MKLSNAFSFLQDLWLGITIAFLPTLKSILRNPMLLLSPSKISQLYMTNVWLVFGDGVDGNAKDAKDTLISPYASGVVLDIGAGHGHTVRYLDRARVSRYIALEPNALMHPHIRAQADDAGFHEADGTLIILSCGAEDTKAILSTLALASPTENNSQPSAAPVDTIVSILTLCTVPDPERTVANMVRDVLKPGGQFLMYEHVLSARSDVAWWQRFWAPLWSVGFDGCRMDRASDVLMRNLKLKDEDGKNVGAWREMRLWRKEGEDEENLFFHSIGRFIRI
ncbi:hypothetical protein BDN70DRAFT_876286 [Pholiota conissans]|uniref:S-adenosyl-L-methionine-dependent methyltransferase n=1 Tax=Pholiota conissans TaxID=109636 RepID=A0A9P6D3C4_9AGAR|nr:hypothetical protein BDN70DRAFT_876286 [Pholiota conissans]